LPVPPCGTYLCKRAAYAWGCNAYRADGVVVDFQPFEISSGAQMNTPRKLHRRILGYLTFALPFGALLIMATSLLAASGIYSFTLNSIDGKPWW
jgi:hypothetical protein